MIANQGGEIRAVHPGMKGSSDMCLSTGFQSGALRPYSSHLDLISAAKAWRTSSLSRFLIPSLRYILFFGEFGRPKMFMVLGYQTFSASCASSLVAESPASFLTHESPWAMCIASSLNIPSITSAHGLYEQCKASSSWCPAPRSMQKLNMMKSYQVLMG